MSFRDLLEQPSGTTPAKPTGSGFTIPKPKTGGGFKALVDAAQQQQSPIRTSIARPQPKLDLTPSQADPRMSSFYLTGKTKPVPREDFNEPQISTPTGTRERGVREAKAIKSRIGESGFQKLLRGRRSEATAYFAGEQTERILGENFKNLVKRFATGMPKLREGVESVVDATKLDSRVSGFDDRFDQAFGGVKDILFGGVEAVTSPISLLPEEIQEGLEKVAEPAGKIGAAALGKTVEGWGEIFALLSGDSPEEAIAYGKWARSSQRGQILEEIGGLFGQFAVFEGVLKSVKGKVKDGYFWEETVYKSKGVEALEILNKYSDKKLTLNSTPAELKTAARKAAFKNHPDRGGSTKAMSEINVARDYLEVQAFKNPATGQTIYASKSWWAEQGTKIKDLWEKITREPEKANEIIMRELPAMSETSRLKMVQSIDYLREQKLSKQPIGEQRPVGLTGLQKDAFGEARPIRFFPDAGEEGVVAQQVTVKEGVKLEEGKTYRAEEIIESGIFEINPKLKDTKIVIKKNDTPAEYEEKTGNIVVDFRSIDNIGAYLVHELQHKHDVETLKMFDFEKMTDKELATIDSPHEKRAYITQILSFLKGNGNPESFSSVIDSNLAAGHLPSHEASVLHRYLDEAVKIFEQTQTKPITKEDDVQPTKEFETLPVEESIAEELKKVGPKRISPDRTIHQQTTPELAIEKMKDAELALFNEVIELIKKHPYGIKAPKKVFTQFEEITKKISEDKATEFEVKWYEKVEARIEPARKFQEVALKLEDKDIFKKVGATEKLQEHINEITDATIREDYIALVKKDISRGFKYPDEVLDFDKSFKTAVDSRERYEKGLRTSFGVDDARIVFDAVEQIGTGMKRQDGKELTDAQKTEIIEGVVETGNALGIDFGELAKDKRWIYVHLNRKNPFLMKDLSGLHRVSKEGTSISIGGSELGTKSTISHELGHALDGEAGGKLFTPGFILARKLDFNKGQAWKDSSTKTRNYFQKDTEIVARLIQQFVEVDRGITTIFSKMGFWNKEIFESEIQPEVEKQIEANFSEFRRVEKQVVEKLEDPLKKEDSLVEDPLIQEAKKYKTAEEFVEFSQRLRGDYDQFRDGAYDSDLNKMRLAAYRQEKILEELTSKLDEIRDAGKDDKSTLNDLKSAREKLHSLNQEAENRFERIKIISNKSSLLSAAELTDIYNKANQIESEVPSVSELTDALGFDIPKYEQLTAQEAATIMEKYKLAKQELTDARKDLKGIKAGLGGFGIGKTNLEILEQYAQTNPDAALLLDKINKAEKKFKEVEDRKDKAEAIQENAELLSEAKTKLQRQSSRDTSVSDKASRKKRISQAKRKVVDQTSFEKSDYFKVSAEEILKRDKQLSKQPTLTGVVKEINKIRRAAEKVARERLVKIEKLEKRITSMKDKTAIAKRRMRLKVLQEMLDLTDSEIRKATRNRDFTILTDAQFEKYFGLVQSRAQEVFKKKLELWAVKHIIATKQLAKEDNLREAMKLPPITKMNIEQLQQYGEALNQFQTGDMFLSKRAIETMKHTSTGEIKTVRELRENFLKDTRLSPDNLSIAKSGWVDKLLYDVSLAKRNPLYALMVKETTANFAHSDQKVIEIERELYDLLKKARKSRGKDLTGKIWELFAPQDKEVFNYVEKNIAPEEGVLLTKEELELGNYLHKLFTGFKDKLIEQGTLDKYRKDYITHTQRGLFESIRDAGLRAGMKEFWNAKWDDYFDFNLAGQPDQILGFEKFFKYAMRRSDKLIPSKNIGQATMNYVRTFYKKEALDNVIPKIATYSKAFSDGNAQNFINAWFNNKKGRRLDSRFQGTKTDMLLGGLRILIALKDLGFSVPVALGSYIGEFGAYFIGSSPKTMALGSKRVWTKQGNKIAKDYAGAFGRDPAEAIFRSPEKNIVEKTREAAFGLLQYFAWTTRKQRFLGSLTKEEYQTGVISKERVGEIIEDIGRTQQIANFKSVLGSTALGRAGMMYKGWAVPLATNILSNIKWLLTHRPSQSGKQALELSKALAISAALYLIIDSFIDDEDDSFVGLTLQKARRESTSALSALDATFWTSTRVTSFTDDIASSLWSIIKMEEYKTSGADYKKGESKGVRRLQRTLTPNVIKQFGGGILPSGKSTSSSSSRRNTPIGASSSSSSGTGRNTSLGF